MHGYHHGYHYIAIKTGGNMARDKGEGSVHQAHVKDCERPVNGRGKSTCGCRWRGTIESGYTKTGSRRRLTVSGKDEVEAKRKLRDLRVKIETDGAPSASARTTVKKYAEAWLEERRTKIRATPWKTDASAVKVWIVPTIGHKRLDQLTPADIKAVNTAGRKAGRAGSTRLRTHVTLTSMLREAMIDGHAVPGRVLLVDGPSISEGDREPMTTDEIGEVMNVAHEHLPHWSRWLYQVLYGPRPAEARGLTWAEVDFGRELVANKWQLKRLPLVEKRNRASGYVRPEGVKARHLVDDWHLTEVKSKKGERIFPLIPLMAAALEEWRQVAPHSPHDLVWPAPDGRPMNEKRDVAEWYALQETAYVSHPYAPRHYFIYEARHAFATRLMEMGADEKVITSLMGHASIVTSRGYMHADMRHTLAAIEQTAATLALPGA